MIEIKNIHFAYNSKKVLKDICIRLEKGKLYGIIGPNGSGKSTLLRLISNELQGNTGEILIDGENIKN